MSYLDPPRIHFGGQFFTDPSTVNNDPTHYEAETTKPSPWQNPNGQHRYQLKGCMVKSAVDENGDVTGDPIIGALFETTDKPSPAKIVDLDVYQQSVPTIYGMQIKITLADGASIVGLVDPVALNQVWFNAVLPTRSWEGGDYVQDSFGGDMNACGWFQSVVRFNVADWPETSSPILQKLREATLIENGQYLVSIKFVTDGYQNVPQDKEYQLGRIVGTLGPVFANEPRHNPGHRWMKARDWKDSDPWYYPSFMDSPFKVDVNRKKLILDLANSICRQMAGGGPVDLGTLTASAVTPEPAILEIGAVDYSEFTYNGHAAITELDLNDAQILALQNNRLALSTSKNDIGQQNVLLEADSKVNYAAEIRPIRMMGDPGTTATTRVYISNNGAPLAGKQLNIHLESVHGTTKGATVPPTNPGNTPQADGALTATITPSDASGFATVTLTVVKDPGQRTTELDGQLYFVILYDPDVPHPDWTLVAPAQNQVISVVAWAQYAIDVNPPWEVVQSLLAPYMKLFPYMKRQLDLTDPHTFHVFTMNPPWDLTYGNIPPGPLGINAGAIPYYLSRDFNNPKYMPVTRDLSPNKVMTIMHFIKNMQDAPPPAQNTSV